jgi:hypothetical protein
MIPKHRGAERVTHCFDAPLGLVMASIRVSPCSALNPPHEPPQPRDGPQGHHALWATGSTR